MEVKNSKMRNCRYYHGEAKCPFEYFPMSWYWDMERVFVSVYGRIHSEQSSLYKAIGGKTFPGVPYALLLLMFTSWGKYAYDLKASLPDFYRLVDDYLEIASDHFPKDKVPK